MCRQPQFLRSRNELRVNGAAQLLSALVTTKRISLVVWGMRALDTKLVSSVMRGQFPGPISIMWTDVTILPVGAGTVRTDSKMVA
jgi:hypothetical protein